MQSYLFASLIVYLAAGRSFGGFRVDSRSLQDGENHTKMYRPAEEKDCLLGKEDAVAEDGTKKDAEEKLQLVANRAVINGNIDIPPVSVVVELEDVRPAHDVDSVKSAPEQPKFFFSIVASARQVIHMDGDTVSEVFADQRVHENFTNTDENHTDVSADV